MAFEADLRRIKEAVLTIQRRWRCRLSAKRLQIEQRREWAAVLIQRYFRRYLLQKRRSIRERQERAATLIQSHFRCHLLRNRLRRAQQEAQLQSMDDFLQDMDFGAEDMAWLEEQCMEEDPIDVTFSNPGSSTPQAPPPPAEESSLEASLDQWGFQNEQTAQNYYKSWKRQRRQRTQKQWREQRKNPQV